MKMSVPTKFVSRASAPEEGSEGEIDDEGMKKFAISTSPN